MFQKNVVDKIKTLFMFSNFTSFWKILQFMIFSVKKNIVEPEKLQMAIRRMGISRWGSEATDTNTRTLRICNTSCFSTATTVARMCLRVTSYFLCLSCSEINSKLINTLCLTEYKILNVELESIQGNY